MKYFLIAFILFPIFVFSQDIVLKKNGDELNVKVDNVLADVIIYSDSSGRYSIEREAVFMIKYSDGSKEVLYNKNIAGGNSASVKPAYDKLTYSEEEDYYINSVRTSEGSVNQLLKTSANPEIQDLLKKKSELTVSSNFLKYGSIPVGVLGTFCLLAYMSGASTTGAAPDMQTIGGAGLIGVTAFAGMQVGAALISSKRTKTFKAAIDKYNQDLEKN